MTNFNLQCGYRTRTFSEIFTDAENFLSVYNDIGIPALLEENDVTTLYYLLYARYGTSHIAFTDEKQFIYSVFSIIFQYGPTWSKQLDVQDKLRNIEDADLVIGGKAIYNHSYNPSTAPSTNSLEELTTINDQNTTNYKKSKLEGYANLLDLLETDVTELLLSKFRQLFIRVLAPDPFYYCVEDGYGEDI